MLGFAVTFFVINQYTFEPLDEKLLAERQSLTEVELLIEQESNSSEANMTAMLKISRDFRKELEQLEEGGEGAKEELSFLLPKIKNLNEQLNSSKQELDRAEEKIVQINASTMAEKAKIEPLTKQKDEILSQLKEISLSHSRAEENWRQLDQNFSALSRVRDAALESYNDSRMPVMAEIIRPFEIFYGDRIEIEVESVSKKEKGFFAKFGLEQGIRSDFIFIVQADEGWSELPIFVTCSLAEKDYSFFKIVDSVESTKNRTFIPGEKLTLIRSAELSNSNLSLNFDDD